MKLLYGVVGEGMGHATRSRVVIEHLLAAGHELLVVVSGRAHAYLLRELGGELTHLGERRRRLGRRRPAVEDHLDTEGMGDHPAHVPIGTQRLHGEIIRADVARATISSSGIA